MKLRKLLSLLLAGAMAFSLASCQGQETVTNNESEAASSDAASSEAESTEPTENQLIIGTITQMESEFYDASFSNAATNYQMYGLLHGYTTVTATKEGEYEYDPTVVASHEETENEDGTKTYTVTINDGQIGRAHV